MALNEYFVFVSYVVSEYVKHRCSLVPPHSAEENSKSSHVTDKNPGGNWDKGPVLYKTTGRETGQLN